MDRYIRNTAPGYQEGVDDLSQVISECFLGLLATHE